jgi:hypothetical protein
LAASIALLQVFPGGIVGLVEEEAGIAGIFRIDVDFASGDRLAQHGRGAERMRSCVLMPLALSASRMMLPSNVPSVSIFDDTTTSAA